jgi:hypothetical protein
VVLEPGTTVSGLATNGRVHDHIAGCLAAT